ncbi:hypothetical protein ACKWTF_010173 [Chironomus riparius]
MVLNISKCLMMSDSQKSFQRQRTDSQMLSIKMQRSSIFLILILITSSLKVIFCGTKIDGDFDDTYWYPLDIKVWTWWINGNVEISSKNVEISAKQSEFIKAINFRNNKKIEFLPIKVYKKLQNLNVFQAFNCAVQEVKYENFQNLAELQLVSLASNEISNIPKDTFKDLSNLKHLELRMNNIQTIHELSFQNHINLRFLNIGSNEISYISPTTFENLKELRNISMSDNTLQSLGDEHFKNNKKLERIWLQNNKIHILSPTMFDHLKNLVVANFTGNSCIDRLFEVNEDEFCALKVLGLKEIIKKNCES